MRPTILYLAGCLLLAGCAGRDARRLPYYRDADLTPEWLDRSVADAPAMHRVKGFHLVDQHGQPMTDTTFAGHVTLVSFFFSACGSVCPLTRTHLDAALARFPGDARLQVMLHSVTPEADSVATLARYASAYHLVDPRWHLVTGTRDEVERVARDGYFVNLHDGSDYGTSQLAHTENILVIDQAGRIRGVYAGSLPLEVERMAADLRVLLSEG